MKFLIKYKPYKDIKEYLTLFLKNYIAIEY